MDNNYRHITIGDVTMCLYGEQDSISDDIIRDNNFWEHDRFEAWKHHFPTSGFMLDIGGNIGNHCLMFHNSFPELKIWAFEMSFKNFDLLKKNIAPYPQITGFNVALSDATKVIQYDDSIDHNNGGIGIKSEGAHSNLAIPLDSLNITEPVSLIKIDIEGHEIQAYNGMKNILLKDKPLIWAEDWVQSGHWQGESSVQYLLDMGYEIIENIIGDYLLKHKDK
jgi:FkbM family methyltransferase